MEIRVRYAEVDAMGYLHHARYMVYFEMGRTELLRLNGVRYAELEPRGLFYVVAKLECRYRAAARYDEVLTLRTRAKRLSFVRVDHEYELFRGDTLLAEASTILALVNRDGVPTRLPDELYDKLTGARVGSP
jgi:acyl-CoA thioester hydrolase